MTKLPLELSGGFPIDPLGLKPGLIDEDMEDSAYQDRVSATVRASAAPLTQAEPLIHDFRVPASTDTKWRRADISPRLGGR